MGNWRTVNILGTVNELEMQALRDACTIGNNYFHPLSISDGLMGLGNWVNIIINARGNLAERDYTIEDVAHTLEKLVKVAPSTQLKVHCGGDYESQKCIATISVKEGKVTIGSPEVDAIVGASEDEMMGRMFKQLQRGKSY